ncbi:MAG: hypothetical protein P8Q37_09190 [Porticoccaceae bacterium]|nr:hypothetical protein [Porticoccaceae bacterium]MDG1475070.1 hypothetical protein [Porticoccaceae bacterium]
MIIKKLYLILFTSLTLLVSGCDQAVKAPPEGGVVFNELMPVSAIQHVQPTQWLELSNITTASVNLIGCKISNQNQQMFQITDDLIIESRDFSVIPSAATTQHTAHNVLRDANITFASEDFNIVEIGELSLSCDGRIIDKVIYEVSPKTVAASARSWQLASDLPESDLQMNEKKWCSAILIESLMYDDRRFASPGARNPVCEAAMPYVSYNDQQSVLIKNIDWQATLKVAEAEFARKLSTSELPIWGIRDQVITPDIATKIAALYFDNIDMLYETSPFTMLDWNHAVWHLSWAISNLYRNGNAEVKKRLQLAYQDAIKRPETLERFTYMAIDHIRNDIVVMGDIHAPANKRMKQLIVVPGNPEYLQSYDEYENNVRSPILLKAIHLLYTLKTFFTDSAY